MPGGDVDLLSPRVRRTYLALASEIDSGGLASGAKLPNNTKLAARFGVSAVTMLRVLSELQKAGLVSVEHGRGTFVTTPSKPEVLIVDDGEADRLVLRSHAERFGCHAVEASGPVQALEFLERDPSIRVCFSDVRMPLAKDGVDFIVRVRQRYPELAVVAVTGHSGDLESLHGKPECPILVLAKPVRAKHVEEALRLVLERQTG
jgi:CheY-like chemotaxis protein